MRLTRTRTRKKELRRKGIRTERIELLPKAPSGRELARSDWGSGVQFCIVLSSTVRRKLVNGFGTPSTARREPPKLGKLTSGNPKARSPSLKVEAINAPKVHITYPKGIYHGHEVSISREQKRIYYPWALRYAFAHISLRVTRGPLTPSTAIISLILHMLTELNRYAFWKIGWNSLNRQIRI